MPGWIWDKYTIKSPTRLSYIDFYSLGNLRCAELEIEWLKCADRVGLVNSKEKCPELFQDFKECATRTYSDLRSVAIRKEMVKQNRPVLSPKEDMEFKP